MTAFRLRKRLDRVKETENIDLQRDSVTRDFDGNIETGFQIATLHGPLCAEPMEGMAFFVERVDIDRDGVRKENGRRERLSIWATEESLMSAMPEQNKLSQITGSLISAIKEGCRNGLLDWSPRLKLAMYSCDIQASSKRRCRLSYQPHLLNGGSLLVDKRTSWARCTVLWQSDAVRSLLRR